MKTSASSCLKVLSCSCSPQDANDLQLSPASPEAKRQSDKRRWSFRKRSARHRVLSNTVTAETLSSVNKDTLELAEPTQKTDSSVTDKKLSVLDNGDEKLQLPALAQSKVPDNDAIQDQKDSSSQPDESNIVALQTAIRGVLAQNELQKRKNVVVLQAVARGHIVRKHAVGTLRCVQAIVKMQALVRARHARLSNDKLRSGDEVQVKDTNSITARYVSLDKLLSNGFARQLMESTANNKPINIKCDSTKPDSAWNWLERWMSVSYAEPSPRPEPPMDELTKVPDETSLLPVEVRVTGEEIVAEGDLKTISGEDNNVLDKEETLITYEADNLHSSKACLSVEAAHSSEVRDISMTTKSLIEGEQVGIASKEMLGIVSCDPDKDLKLVDKLETHQSMERMTSDDPNLEGKKNGFGSRKVSNPSFIAAHTMFEEMSYASNQSRSLSQDLVGESKANIVASATETVTQTTGVNLEQSSLHHVPSVHYGGSECGTELSVTSTLDSPDAFDVADLSFAKDVIHENSEVVGPTTASLVDQSVKIEQPVAVESMPEVNKAEKNEFHGRNINPETGGVEVYSVSQVASPSSHVTASESQGTPSSQVSVKAKRRHDRSGSNQRRKFYSNKGSTLMSFGDRVGESAEQMLIHQKTGRKNYFGSPKPDQNDEMPRDSDGSNSSLPHFMQATESAKAKVNANNSPRSSPDVQDRELTKKRHSIPGANGRQDSPRIQRMMSQGQQGSKGAVSYVVHEKKWQR